MTINPIRENKQNEHTLPNEQEAYNYKSCCEAPLRIDVPQLYVAYEPTRRSVVRSRAVKHRIMATQTTSANVTQNYTSRECTAFGAEIYKVTALTVHIKLNRLSVE